jgi:hypothetical protein
MSSPFLDPQQKPQSARGWPDPLQLMELRDLVEAGKERGFIGTREFTIRYAGEMFFVKPVKGMAPCGWFDRKTAFIELT